VDEGVHEIRFQDKTLEFDTFAYKSTAVGENHLDQEVQTRQVLFPGKHQKDRVLVGVLAGSLVGKDERTVGVLGVADARFQIAKSGICTPTCEVIVIAVLLVLTTNDPEFTVNKLGAQLISYFFVGTVERPVTVIM
jgi:hypothetical protein